MAAMNRPTTGSGLTDVFGARFSFARCGLAGTYIESGVMTILEAGEKTVVPTTAFLGYRYAYPGTKLLTGTIEGYAAAADTSGITGANLQSNLPAISTPIDFSLVAGAFQVTGTVILDDLDFRTGPNDVNSLKWSWTMVGNPTIRRIYGMTEVTG